MNATQSTVKVGDVLVFVARNNAKPVTVNVSKVTKAGWVKFTHTDGKESSAYKPARYGEGWELTSNGYTSGRLYLVGKLDELNEVYEKRQQEEKEKAEKWNEQNHQREVQRQAELAELKAVVGTELKPLMETDLGEGKVLVFKLPVKADLQERNGTEQVVMVRVKLGTRWSVRNGEQPEWEAYPTWAHKGTSSFSSCSACVDTTEEAAVWEALRYVYNNW